MVNHLFVGIDGCRGGWMTVAIGCDSRRAAVDVYSNWANVLDAFSDADTMAVDMPIGLVDCGRRQCDVEARRLLGRERASSVFAPPRRPMLACVDYESANTWGKSQGRRHKTGGGLSKQAWNLIPRIREIDEAITPQDQDRIIEAHPELAFWALNENLCAFPKRTVDGQKQRMQLLAEAGFHGLNDLCTRTLDLLPRKTAAIDDLLDACVLALTARRKYQSEAVGLGNSEQIDQRGLRMMIWY